MVLPLDSSDLFGVLGARLLYGLRYNFARINRDGSAESVTLSTTGTGVRLPVHELKRIGTMLKRLSMSPAHWITSYLSGTVFGQEEASPVVPPLLL